ncbi:acyl carrier protein [Campylobacter molothri]|uniref:acyl carrier protein n=2 Tax=Campylobacter molothri TaxID=1032242 RepID=UPI00301BAB57|nr:acyl carrier protein [Campylobacter sp. RM9753]
MTILFIVNILFGDFMDKNEFLKVIAEILMTNESNLKEETELNSFPDFDSIAALEISMFFEKRLNIEVFPMEIKKKKTIKDLLELGKFI